MTSTNDLDDKIRDMLAELDRAAPRPPAFDDLPRSVRNERPRFAPLAVAAAIVALGAGGVLAVSARHPDTTSAPATLPPASRTSAGFRIETPTVRMDAASIEVVAADRTWVPSADLVVDGDPGMPNEYTSLELTWHDNGVEQRVHLYFASNGVDWWVNEIRTYDGQVPGDWITPLAQGEYFRSPLGTAFAGDLDLPNLRIREMRLEAFLRPHVCDNPIAPLALLADFPVIDSSDGGFGATFQLIDTATCTPLAVSQYQFEYTADDPAIVRIEPPEEFDGYPEIKTRVGMTFLAPGMTTVRATARNSTGEIVGVATMQVSVRTSSDETLDTIAPESETPATVPGSAEGRSEADLAADIATRVGYVIEPLAALGYTVIATDSPTNALTTITAESDDSRTIIITMSPGTPLQPENHNRVPITVDEQTDLQIRGHVESNNGWSFEITADRSPAGGLLPTGDQLQEILYALDP